MERKVSSVVLREEYLGGGAGGGGSYDNVRYVEVPVVEEIIKHVPRREVVEVEKRVPRIEYQYVDRQVEVPEVKYVDRVVEVPEIQEQVKLVPRVQHVEVPREVVERVPRIEKRYHEKIVDVPGEVIEVPKPYVVEKDVFVPNYVPERHPVMIAQALRPIICPSPERIRVPVTEWRPQIIEYPVPVPRVVDTPLINRGLVAVDHHDVRITQKEYRSLLRRLNPHLTYEQMDAFSKNMSMDGFVRGTQGPAKYIPSGRYDPNGHILASSGYDANLGRTPPPMGLFNTSTFTQSGFNLPLMPGIPQSPINLAYHNVTPPPASMPPYVPSQGQISWPYGNQLMTSGVRFGGAVVSPVSQFPAYESDRGAILASNIQPYHLSRGAFSPVRGPAVTKVHKKRSRSSRKSKR